MAEVVITIRLDENRQVQVNGPIDDQLVMFGLLELAKQAVVEHARAQRVQTARLPELVRLGGH